MSQIIGLGLIIAMICVAFMGAAYIAQDGNDNIIGKNISGTQNDTPVATMIKSTATSSIDIMGILILIFVIFIVLVFLFLAYAITR